jgi:hypothetical protein
MSLMIYNRVEIRSGNTFLPGNGSYKEVVGGKRLFGGKAGASHTAVFHSGDRKPE